jgi:hypothetical protein
MLPCLKTLESVACTNLPSVRLPRSRAAVCPHPKQPQRKCVRFLNVTRMRWQTRNCHLYRRRCTSTLQNTSSDGCMGNSDPDHMVPTRGRFGSRSLGRGSAEYSPSHLDLPRCFQVRATLMSGLRASPVSTPSLSKSWLTVKYLVNS